jgi:fibronectin-binding autotransporter adhesin
MQNDSPRQLRAHSRALIGTSSFLATLLFLSSLFSSAVAHAQTVNWGVNGAGGSGTWDTTTADWFDGTNNVIWPSAGNAIFGGAPGGSVSVSGSPIVSSMTFNTGYDVVNGTLLAGPSGLTVTTNADTSITSAIKSSAPAGNILIKNGPAALSLNFGTTVGAIQVNQGALNIGGDLPFSDVTLANAPGVMTTISSSLGINSLSGGGALGGVVQPLNSSGQATLELGGGNGSFNGVLQNNGGGVLALQMNGQNPVTQSLTGANTYSGPTTIAGGTLALAGSGSAVNSTISISTPGALLLDNSTTALANRISDSAAVTMNGGSIQLVGNGTTPVNELAGSLSISSYNNITVTQPGSAAAQISFAGFTRNNHATVSVVGPGVALPGVSNGGTGIVAPYITAGNEWATIGADGRIAPYTAYATDINTGSNTDNVKITATGTTTLANSATRSSLNLQNSNVAVGQVLDLGGKNLTLTAGGILSSGAGNSTITGGNLNSAAQELVVTSNNSLAIGANIGDGNSATTLTKTGPGVLTLSGNNSYTGTTAINQGTLVVGADANLGQGSNIEMGVGTTLQAAGNFSSTKGFTTLGSNPGIINTAGFNVTFSGPNNGYIEQMGGGSLTLSNGSVGKAVANGGTLILPNATSGQVTLIQGGTLQAAGTLTLINLSANGSTLDIGGPAAATLSTTFLTLAHPFFGGSAVVDFGIGATSSDLLNLIGLGPPITSLTPAGAMQFEFQNLGGLKTGVDYPVITYGSTAFPPKVNVFAFAPDMASKGFDGTFHVTSTGVFVNFTSVPEPGTTALLLVQGSVFLLAAARRSRRRAT